MVELSRNINGLKEIKISEYYQLINEPCMLVMHSTCVSVCLCV